MSPNPDDTLGANAELTGVTGALITPGCEDATACAEAELSDTMQDVLTELARTADAVETALQSDLSGINLTVSSVIGAIDSELRQHDSAVAVTTDKAMDGAFRALFMPYEGLRVDGIALPYDFPEMEEILADETGQRTIDVLSGVPLSPPPAPAPAPVELQTFGPSPPLPGIPPTVPPAPGPSTPIEPIPQPAPGAAASDVKPCFPGSYTFTWLDGGANVLVRWNDGTTRTMTASEFYAWNSPCASGPVNPPVPTVPPPPPPTEPPKECACDDVQPLPPPPPTEEPPPPKVAADELWRASRTGPVMWASPDVCTYLSAAIRPLDWDAADAPGGMIERIDWSRPSTTLEGLYETGVGYIGQLFGATDGDGPGAAALSEWASTTLGYGIAAPLMRQLDPESVPDPVGTGRLAVRLAMADRAQVVTGIPLDYLMQRERYLLQYSAPQYIPSQAELDNAYLRNVISEDQWTCLTRANGNVPQTATWALYAGQTRPGVREIIDLYQRGVIGSLEVLDYRLRTEGVLTPSFRDEYLELAKWIPQPPDITRFMVRDVFDEAVVAKYNLDKDFEVKFFGAGGRDNPGPAAKWARASGLDDSLFRYQWRAHWEIPSNTALYEMLHRLRPDRAEVREWEQLNADWRLAHPDTEAPGKPTVVTREDVQRAVEVNDMSPSWVDPILAISYHPMTRTDAINAFMANVRDAKWLHERFRDNGYDESTAREMVAIQELIRAKRVANISGVWTARKVVTEYRRGSIDRNKALALLEPQVPDFGQRTAILDGADAEVEVMIRTKHLARIRRAYIVALYDSVRAIKEQEKYGVPTARARDNVFMWDADKHGRLKEPSAKIVMDWTKTGIETAEGCYNRLLQLGYMPDDARRMVGIAMQGAVEKAEARADKQESKLRRIYTDIRKAKNAETENLEKQAKAIEAEMKKWRAEQERIAKELARRAEPESPAISSMPDMTEQNA